MSTYLGQFTDENAARIMEAFDKAEIRWSSKQSGQFVRTIFAADWGVRLYVEDEQVERAVAVVKKIAPDGLAKRR